MPFSSLPTEIVSQIMIEAVLVRGIQRAQRLRYVSKAWNIAVGRAIIESGVLDNEVNQLSSVHWPYHFAYKALRDKTYATGGIASTRLGICRLVAGRVTGYKGLDANTDAYTQSHVQISKNLARDYYDTLLLGIFAWLNELDLLKGILQFMEAVPSDRDMDNLLYAIGAAAYKGHDEALSLLLSMSNTREHLGDLFEEATEYIISKASEGNQLSTLELGLKLGTRLEPHLITKALLITTSLPIFERLLPLARDYFTRGFTHPVHFGILLKTTFEHQASRGAIPIMDYILCLNDPGLSRDGNYAKWKVPMRRAAKGGSLETVVFLWNHGFPVDKDIFIAAVEHGNPDVVQFLLEQPATADFPLDLALIKAVDNENEKVAIMLLTKGSARLNAKDRRFAMYEAMYRGLESMASLLLEYQIEEWRT
ncbi:multiple ankyrin repeats single KH domain [Apiospora arundinis]|uniref:Multiple ankyrin repeats single KH domain n=1 Tax=Apiospora arundinis TaxID=335852 RepID=A0ABR2HLX6_9PEZI